MTPHPDSPGLSLSCAVITVSDTRTPATDTSGQWIQDQLREAGHQVDHYEIIPDDPHRISQLLRGLGESLQAVICSGGTGISPRDTTYDALTGLLEKQLPGFGELFRWLSYQEVGSRAIASRAVAGTYHNKLIFSLPGSLGAVKLALGTLILPELRHLGRQLAGLP